nr:MAG TPA: hypothetical protein [Bacteriophage sp.]
MRPTIYFLYPLYQRLPLCHMRHCIQYARNHRFRCYQTPNNYLCPICSKAQLLERYNQV